MNAWHRDPSHPLFAAGLASGRKAAASLPANAPFTEDQRRWLDGFLQGLLGDRSRSDEALPAGIAAREQQVAVATRSTSVHSGSRGTYHRHNPYAARVRAAEQVRGGPAALVRVEVDLEGSGIDCRPGDWLGVCPHNEPDMVRQLLKVLGARGQEEVTSPRGSGPAWRALLEEVDLVRPKEELVALLAGVARVQAEARALTTLTLGDDLSAFTVAGLLRRFPSARPRVQEIVSVLRPLVPTAYPIASCRANGEQAAEVLVRVQSDAPAHPPAGVASDFVAARLREHEWLPVYVESGGAVFPDDDTASVILVADGLGIAPCRAYLAERVATHARGRSWLWAEGDVFGVDFATWQTMGPLTRLERLPLPACAEVGHRFEAQADPLWRWLVDQSIVYVFGSRALVDGVEEALQALAAQRCRTTPSDDYVASLRREGRFKTNVFS